MRLLGEFDRVGAERRNGRAVERRAVRAILPEPGSRRLLLVHSAAGADYKFPGGGIHTGETHVEALRRELLEECGTDLAGEGQPFGRVIEHNIPKEADFDVFRMISFYYVCQLAPGRHPLQLDDYERELGFSPQWVGIDEAIRVNRMALQHTAERPRYAERETFVLELVRRQIFGA
jgi:8-oxo-dGTP pyrophosphatase MutT (NUDIX family)